MNRISNRCTKDSRVARPLLLARSFPLLKCHAKSNPFTDNERFRAFSVVGRSQPVRTRRGILARPISKRNTRPSRGQWVVLFRRMCSTYATLCRGTGLRPRPRLPRFLNEFRRAGSRLGDAVKHGEGMRRYREDRSGGRSFSSSLWNCGNRSRPCSFESRARNCAPRALRVFLLSRFPSLRFPSRQPLSP